MVTERDFAPSFVERARELGIEIVQKSGRPQVLWTETSGAPWRTPADVFAFSDGVWPGVPATREGGTASAGPTGVPWVDSNGWRIRLALALRPSQTVWVAVDHPEKMGILRRQEYELAVADAAAYGGRWVIWLDRELRKGLTHKSGTALDVWQGIVQTLRFFERQSRPQDLRPAATVGVVSDFTGANEFLSHEILNLMMRKNLPFVILEKSGAAATGFEGLLAVVYPDREPPGRALQQQLEKFVRQGGLLVVNKDYPAPKGLPAGTDRYRRFGIRRVGKGRIAVSVEDLTDPYLTVVDTFLILSHRHDLFRLYNGGSLYAYLTRDDGFGRALVQLVNYAARGSSNLVSLALRGRYRTAQLRTLEDPHGSHLEPQSAERGWFEYHLPPFATYAAIELEA
ncbi:MAG: hypothetical protein ACUVXB_13235 [Bryobacteraceae bacterium]